MKADEPLIWLSEKEVDELTGIKKGECGQSKHQMQIVWLRSQGYAVIENARGRPILSRTFFDGSVKQSKKADKEWSPSFAG